MQSVLPLCVGAVFAVVACGGSSRETKPVPVPQQKAPKAKPRPKVLSAAQRFDAIAKALRSSKKPLDVGKVLAAHVKDVPKQCSITGTVDVSSLHENLSDKQPRGLLIEISQGQDPCTVKQVSPRFCSVTEAKHKGQLKLVVKVVDTSATGATSVELRSFGPTGKHCSMLTIDHGGPLACGDDDGSHRGELQISELWAFSNGELAMLEKFTIKSTDGGGDSASSETTKLQIKELSHPRKKKGILVLVTETTMESFVEVQGNSRSSSNTTYTAYIITDDCGLEEESMDILRKFPGGDQLPGPVLGGSAP